MAGSHRLHFVIAASCHMVPRATQESIRDNPRRLPLQFAQPLERFSADGN
jgi:hypothetical protein